MSKLKTVYQKGIFVTHPKSGQLTREAINKIVVDSYFCKANAPYIMRTTIEYWSGKPEDAKNPEFKWKVVTAFYLINVKDKLVFQSQTEPYFYITNDNISARPERIFQHIENCYITRRALVDFSGKKGFTLKELITSYTDKYHNQR